MKLSIVFWMVFHFLKQSVENFHYTTTWMLSPVMKALINAALRFFINNWNFEVAPKLFSKLTNIYPKNGLLIVNFSFLIYDHSVRIQYLSPHGNLCNCSSIQSCRFVILCQVLCKSTKTFLRKIFPNCLS